MKKQEWLIKCNYLKNLLDSYGITVVFPVSFPNFPDTRLGNFIGRIQSELEGEFQSIGNKRGANYHITILPIMKSLFAFPEARRRRALCIEMMKQLEETMPLSLSERERNAFLRLTGARTTSVPESMAILNKKWETSNDYLASVPTHNMVFSIGRHVIKITPTGVLILIIFNQVIREVLLSNVNHQKADLRSRHHEDHLTIGYVASIDSYHFLKQIVREYCPDADMKIWIKRPEMVAYQHRSTNRIITKMIL